MNSVIKYLDKIDLLEMFNSTVEVLHKSFNLFFLIPKYNKK
jgi:hypothetical protein